MTKKAGSLHNNNLKYSCTSFFIILITFILFSNVFAIADNNPYVPSKPLGVETGLINVDYEFSYYTTDVGSFWMFDWDDGNFSDWIIVGESDSFVSQTHSWGSYGVYNVKIRHRSVYFGNSSWSAPLEVTIMPPSDLDNDGWSNDIETAYGKDPEDQNDFPLDTDGDKTPDDDSADGSYVGDLDDDNDQISDLIELSLGLNTKDSNDVLPMIIGESYYFLIDVDNNGNFESFYNPQAETKTSTFIEDTKVHFDTNGDGSWDYTYTSGAISVYKAPFPWLYIALGIITFIIVFIFILFKTGVFFLYEEEIVIDEQTKN